MCKSTFGILFLFSFFAGLKMFYAIKNFCFLFFWQHDKGTNKIFGYRTQPACIGINENPVGFTFDKNSIIFDANDSVFSERLHPAKVGYPRQNDNVFSGERGA